MADKKKHLTNWLKDAYAMEQQAIEIAEKQSERIETYPALQQRVAQHLEETRWQADTVQKCLAKLGADTSSLKSGMGKLMGNMKAMGASMSGDEVMKDTLADYMFEHFEIGSYKEIIAAAESAGEPEIADMCREILQQEEAMADWLDSHIPEITTEFLNREAEGLRAKI